MNKFFDIPTPPLISITPVLALVESFVFITTMFPPTYTFPLVTARPPFEITRLPLVELIVSVFFVIFRLPAITAFPPVYKFPNIETPPPLTIKEPEDISVASMLPKIVIFPPTNIFDFTPTPPVTISAPVEVPIA